MLELNLKNKWILSLDVSIPSGEITFLNCNDESSNTIMLNEEKKISKSLLPQIQDTINMFNPVVIHTENDYHPEFDLYDLEIIINFLNFHIYRPQIHENTGASKLMYPQEARLRNFTYASAMTVDIDIKILRRYGAAFEKTVPVSKIFCG